MSERGGERYRPGRDICRGLRSKGDRQIAMSERNLELARGEPAAGRLQRLINDRPKLGRPVECKPRFVVLVCPAKQTLLA